MRRIKSLGEFIVAIQKGDEQEWPALLAYIKANCDQPEQFNKKFCDGYTALLWAIVHEAEPVVMAILALPSINVNCVDEDGNSALMLAAQKGDTAIAIAIALLAVPGIDVNYAEQETGCTALMLAAFWGSRAIVKALLQVPGVQVDAVGQNGESALSLAIENGDTESVTLISRSIARSARVVQDQTNVNDVCDQTWALQSLTIDALIESDVVFPCESVTMTQGSYAWPIVQKEGSLSLTLDDSRGLAERI